MLQMQRKEDQVLVLKQVHQQQCDVLTVKLEKTRELEALGQLHQQHLRDALTSELEEKTRELEALGQVHQQRCDGLGAELEEKTRQLQGKEEQVLVLKQVHQQQMIQLY